jgi:hypothetical protein
MIFLFQNNTGTMNKGKYVYTQIVEFLSQWMFDNIDSKYDGNRYVKHFTCWNQLLVMVFGQLTNRDSLRNLVVAIDASVVRRLFRQIVRRNVSLRRETCTSEVMSQTCHKK